MENKLLQELEQIIADLEKTTPGILRLSLEHLLLKKALSFYADKDNIVDRHGYWNEIYFQSGKDVASHVLDQLLP